MSTLLDHLKRITPIHAMPPDGVSVEDFNDSLFALEDGIKALEAIHLEPHGCPFCDSGKLRNPAKGHTLGCGFYLMNEALKGR